MIPEPTFASSIISCCLMAVFLESLFNLQTLNDAVLMVVVKPKDEINPQLSSCYTDIFWKALHCHFTVAMVLHPNSELKAD